MGIAFRPVFARVSDAKCHLAQDILVDWSLFDPTAEHKLLRPELLYRGDIPVRQNQSQHPLGSLTFHLGQRYYFAIVSLIAASHWIGSHTGHQVSNVLIRCIWVCYFLVPSGLNITPRTFIVASLEVLRRANWNICASLVFPHLAETVNLTFCDK